ncbi:hypothetical protein JYU29_05560 [Tianweitania sp. BSSL-BM11]|uniref:Uncharacterized protein n=1 Tax=Tianweitania aestuarii TaxID=2814886 RepID=A0ABS5RV01_9HYPH|nr:hypothetical protein [Tianweitania aestuarii]MBS9720152.1 hypothetical protein [Tianweitania aestuarii]
MATEDKDPKDQQDLKESMWSVDFIVPVASTVAIFGALLAIGWRFLLGPS